MDESGCRQVLRTTDEHPFWAEGQGWTRADALEPGTSLDTLAGPMWVESLTFTNQRTTVYNLSVQDNPSYFVGPDGVWVHNCGDYRKLFIEVFEAGGRQFPTGHHVHHMLPQEYRHLFPGGEVDQLTNWVGIDRRTHGMINGEWNRFRRAYPNPTADDVRTFTAWVNANYGQHYLRP